MISGWFKGTFFLVLSCGNWEDPPPPCWEKFPNNPVFFFLNAYLCMSTHFEIDDDLQSKFQQKLKDLYIAYRCLEGLCSYIVFWISCLFFIFVSLHLDSVTLSNTHYTVCILNRLHLICAEVAKEMSCHHVIMSSCHHVIMSSCHHVIIALLTSLGRFW